jgi:hypothetical protein
MMVGMVPVNVSDDSANLSLVFGFGLTLAALLLVLFPILRHADGSAGNAAAPAVYPMRPVMAGESRAVVRVTKSGSGAVLQLHYERIIPSGDCQVTLRGGGQTEAAVAACGESFHEFKFAGDYPPGFYTVELTAGDRLVYRYQFEYVAML